MNFTATYTNLPMVSLAEALKPTGVMWLAESKLGSTSLRNY
jgi:hypothetical protein